MERKPTLRIETVDFYKSYMYAVAFNEHYGFRCGYVMIPEGKIYDEKDVECNGGLTFHGDRTDIGLPEGSWMGFDCGHIIRNGIDFDSWEKYMGKDYVYERLRDGVGYGMNGMVMTNEDVINECKNIIDQLN